MEFLATLVAILFTNMYILAIFVFIVMALLLFILEKTDVIKVKTKIMLKLFYPFSILAGGAGEQFLKEPVLQAVFNRYGQTAEARVYEIKESKIIDDAPKRYYLVLRLPTGKFKKIEISEDFKMIWPPPKINDKMQVQYLPYSLDIHPVITNRIGKKNE